LGVDGRATEVEAIAKLGIGQGWLVMDGVRIEANVQ
jgi:hypothetical protein